KVEEFPALANTTSAFNSNSIRCGDVIDAALTFDWPGSRGVCDDAGQNGGGNGARRDFFVYRAN
ncbi:hypothetical protein BaRGS_00022638, partial [Batillaria attramentaria]